MKKKQGKKASKPFVIISLCLVLAIGSAAAYAYGEEIVEIAKFVKNNISAVVYALTNSSEDVSAKKEENDKKQQELLGQVVEVTMRDLTDEERQMLAEGKLTYEEALALIRGETIAPVTTEVIPEVTEEVSAPEQTKPHTPSHKDPITPSQTTAA
nr:hypothetical protein [Clostridia bacterium]